MTGQDPTARLAAAQVELVGAAGRCAEAGAKLEPDRLGQFGAGVAGALDELAAALEAGGDEADVVEPARGVAAAVTASIRDLADLGLDDPGLAFLGSVLTLRTRLSVLDNAAADAARGERP